jgi:hypothetical protein
VEWKEAFFTASENITLIAIFRIVRCEKKYERYCECRGLVTSIVSHLIPIKEHVQRFEKEETMKRSLLSGLLGIVVVLNSVFICAIPAVASPTPATMPRVIYWTDEEFHVNMVKIFGPEASRVVQVKKKLDLDFNDMSISSVPFESPNWCGYVQDNSGTTTIYGVMGHFTARHCVGPGWPYPWDSEWLGVGGPNILQTGVNMKTMKAWVELYPNQQEQSVFSVNAGDDIHASVGRSDILPGYWYVAIIDQTTYQGYGVYYAYTLNQNQAEWIVENNPSFPMGTFGTVYFTSCYWWDSSLTYRPMGYGTGTLYQYHINNESGYLYPSATTGTSFSVTKN